MRIFISYKREEQATAESVRQHLESLGYQTWMDVHSIPSGVSWADAIEQGLRESDVVLGLMSERSIASPNVKNEWDYALVYGEKFNTRLILAKLDECVVPLNYVRLNWVDWRKGVDFSRLKTALDNPTPSPAASIPPAEKAYLEWLYHRLNTVLAAKIIFSDPANPDPIALVTERTRGAVDALFEKTPELDPLFAAMGLNNPDDSADYSSFGAAFDALDQRVLLLGEPGAGKTITLLHMARDAVVRRTQDRNAPLPLYAIIPYWDAYQHTDWLPWLQSQSMNKLPTLVDDYTQGRLLLVLDGLDELGNSRPIDPKKEDGPTFDPRLRFMAQLPAHNAVVVSCRIKDYHDIGQAIKLRGAITLQKLSTAQIEGFLAKMPPLLEAIHSDDRLRELVETPLLLSLFAVGYRDSSEEELRALADLAHSPGDLRDKIFERYVQERYEHEARKYRLRGEQPPYSLEEVYDRLGYVAVWNGGGGWQEEDNILKGDYSGCLDAAFVEFATRINLLDTDDKEHTLRFIHLRLRDYFAYMWGVIPEYESRLTTHQRHDIRHHIVRMLGRIVDVRATSALMLCLRDTQWLIRRDSAKVLGLIGNVDSIPALVAGLSDENEQVRGSCSEALAQMGPAAVTALIEAIQANGSEARYGAATALGQIGLMEATPALLMVLDDANPGTRGRAAFALGKIGSIQAVPALLHAMNKANASFEGPEEYAYDMAREALAMIGSKAVPIILGYLNDSDHSMRRDAVVVLGDIADPIALSPLTSALKDEWVYTRISAAAALGKLGDEKSIKRLVRVIRKDKDEGLRDTAIRALGQIGGPQAVSALKAYLRNTKGEWYRLCDAAANALEAIGTPEALAAVRQWEQTDIGKQRRRR